jgi:transglutaminase-like putative cysteine protease/predicted glutamine amidotransferase
VTDTAPPSEPPSGRSVKAQEHTLTRLVAMSFDGPASPSFSLPKASREERTKLPYGWGFAWYPENSASAMVIKDPTSIGDNPMTMLLRTWERFHSTIFVAHLRGAARTLREDDTHPFMRSFAGRDWVFAHNGDLASQDGAPLEEALGLEPDLALVPVGRTDSELAFCWLLAKAHKVGASSIGAIGWERLHAWFRELDGFGTANFILSDGKDLAVYSDDTRYNQLHYARLVPPHADPKLGTEDIGVDLSDAHERTRTVAMVSTEPLSEGPWSAMDRGQLVVLRRGAMVYDSHADERTRRLYVTPRPPERPRSRAEGAGLPSREQKSSKPPRALQRRREVGLQRQSQQQQGQQRQGEGGPEAPPLRAGQTQQAHQSSLDGAAPPMLASTPPADASRTDSYRPAELRTLKEERTPRLHLDQRPRPRPRSRILSVVHDTRYRYRTPVERSVHVFRLAPVQDYHQEVLDHALDVRLDGYRRDHEDVFGNRVTRCEFSHAYHELRVVSRSIVRVPEEPPETLYAPERRFSIPLVWMPWQRQVMFPYLLPTELPETQLEELYEFALSFVERQDGDLVQTLLDMNTTIYRDFEYVSGSTTLETTPWEVFVHRKGVCQDFANLMICMARLLGIPARYRVGYIHTGANYQNTIQSEASHAWAELYLPWIGWQGFDPTNGILAGRDHIKVACGRNYRDATPTSGTIYRGGGYETLEVDVRVDELSEEELLHPESVADGG